MKSNGEELLRVVDLRCAFRRDGAWLPVVDGVSFSLSPGKTLCLVGESGCGKTMTALSIMGLLPPGAALRAGSIHFDGKDLRALSEGGLRGLRGRRMAMIFQEPTSSLNPVMRIGAQISESLRAHRGMRPREARREAAALLAEVGVADSERRLDAYPHELSGGLCQRVLCAIALAGDPALLIADEPSTALDVTLQAQLLDLLAELQRRRGLAILLITHDLGVVAELGDDVLVMYAGQVVESAPVDELLSRPGHPYTQGLLASLPRIERRLERLEGIPGNVPLPGRASGGCRFRERCALAGAGCESEQELRGVAPRHELRCWRAGSA